ncbi:hypothetical protein [Chromohalobacter sp. 296-RDG]|uniref:hypothetical protein n=1 Tax=Chromohalobacter sp. 296-RDG TaxID=2994062 RepID=UPI0024695491|nr:hypothetical protein [Chromohalobacter sp. 296-RDG]
MQWHICDEAYEIVRQHPITKQMESLSGLTFRELYTSTLDIFIFDPPDEFEGDRLFFGAVSLDSLPPRLATDVKAFCLLVWSHSHEAQEPRLELHREKAFEHLANYERGMGYAENEATKAAASSRQSGIASKPRSPVKTEFMSRYGRFYGSMTIADLWSNLYHLLDDSGRDPRDREHPSGEPMYEYTDDRGRRKQLKKSSFQRWFSQST